jgi:hypothetical protein
VETASESLHEVVVLSRRAREAVEEQQRRSRRIACLSVEDLAAGHRDRPIRGHVGSFVAVDVLKDMSATAAAASYRPASKNDPAPDTDLP